MLFRLVPVLFLVILLLSCNKPAERKEFAFAVHGGAGMIAPENLAPEKQQAAKEKLTEALMTGYDILKNGGSSLDAVEKALNLLEDSPLFNAGKGAVFTADGRNELDASIMDGSNLMAGAVAGVSRIKNPISLARMVMERTPHVLLARDGAEAFAVEQGVELVDPSYFFTDQKMRELERIQKEQSAIDFNLDHKFGTVGAVALDKNGNLAAGTTTGGMSNKKFGRIGDSPIIGAGTYANNKACAVSATGHGEYFIRGVIAYDIAALMQYGNMPMGKAASLIIMQKLESMGGKGGVIAMDYNGAVTMPFNTKNMYRGYVYPDGEPVVMIFQE
jgi:beta-aspartyl-peptidase (threonine type)